MISVITNTVLAALLAGTTLQPIVQPVPGIENMIKGGIIRSDTISAGIEVTAKAVAIVDVETGQLLYEKNSAAVVPIASITKAFTAFIALQSTTASSTVTVLPEHQRPGGRIALRNNEIINRNDALHSALIASSNEAAIALASTTSDQFMQLMNQWLIQQRLTETTFIDPAGLSPENKSTAYELARIAPLLFSDELLQAIYQKQEYQFTTNNTQRAVTLNATNQLLDSLINQAPYTIIAAKTGYLDEAGNCLLLVIEHEDGQQIAAAVLGSATTNDRWQEVKGLIDWVFANYSWPTTSGS